MASSQLAVGGIWCSFGGNSDVNWVLLAHKKDGAIAPSGKTNDTTYYLSACYFLPSICRSMAAMARAVFKKESGVTEMLSMPSSTRNCAKSGKSEGPWPQMPTLVLHSLAVRISMRNNDLTASLRSSYK